MMTGDNERTAKVVAAAVGVTGIIPPSASAFLNNASTIEISLKLLG